MREWCWILVVWATITDGTNAIQNISKNGLLILLGMQPRNNKKSLSDLHACHYALERARSYPKTWYDGTQSIIVSQVNNVSDLLSYNMTTWIVCPVGMLMNISYDTS